MAEKQNGVFLDGDEMVHIQNFRFRNVFFFGDLINAFVRGLEGGSSKDVFQTSSFSTSNLWFCSICFKTEVSFGHRNRGKKTDGLN